MLAVVMDLSVGAFATDLEFLNELVSIPSASADIPQLKCQVDMVALFLTWVSIPLDMCTSYLENQRP